MYCTHLKRSLPVLLKLTARDLTATSTSVFCRAPPPASPRLTSPPPPPPTPASDSSRPAWCNADWIKSTVLKEKMFQIHDVLTRIRSTGLRILLLSSVILTKSKFFLPGFSCLLVTDGALMRYPVHQFSKIDIKKSQNCRNQGFPSFFCLLMEGSWNNIIIWIRTSKKFTVLQIENTERSCIGYRITSR